MKNIIPVCPVARCGKRNVTAGHVLGHSNHKRKLNLSIRERERRRARLNKAREFRHVKKADTNRTPANAG